MIRVVIFCLLGIVLSSCGKERTENILTSLEAESQSNATVILDTLFEINMSIETTDSITSINAAPYVGYYKDDNIGEIYSQLHFSIPSPGSLFPLDFEILESFIFLKYGDKNQTWGVNYNQIFPPMTVSIFELTENIGINDTYYINDVVPLGNKIAGGQFYPNYFDADRKVFIYEEDSFRLSNGAFFEMDESYKNKFISYYYANRDVQKTFSTEFRGLAIVPEKDETPNGEEVNNGMFMNFDMDSSFIGFIYYNTVNQTYENTYINFSSDRSTNYRTARYIFKPDIQAELEDDDFDSLMYLTASTRIKIDFTNLLELKKYKDITIHDAELQIKVHHYNKYESEYRSAPQVLRMYYYEGDITDRVEKINIADQRLRRGVFNGQLGFDPNYVGDNNFYIFNITFHLQKFLRGKTGEELDVETPYVYIEIADPKSYPGVVTLENSLDKEGTRLEVSYSFNH